MGKLAVLLTAAGAVALALCLSCSNETTNPGEPHPPVPSNPQPASGATRIGVYTSLSWECGDPENDQVTYDLYLGTDPHPPLYYSRLRQNSYSPYHLAYDSVYYWKVVAINEAYNATSGPVWDFRTATESEQPPGPPSSPSPGNGYSAVRPAEVTLSWSCYNPSGAHLTFNVYFGTATQPPLVSSGQEQQTYSAGQLADSVTYYWRIEAIADQVTTSGPTWHFTTGTSVNQPPNQPSVMTPADSVIDVSIYSILRWTGSDPENDPLTYKLYFGATNPPPFIGNQLNSTYTPLDALQYGTIYYWQIVSMDNRGNETSGPVWTFTTQPGNVQEVGSLDLGSYARLSFQGSYAYAGTYDGVIVVDISNPVAPREDGRCSTSSAGTYDIFAAGSYAYLSCNGYSLKIVDITDPSNPSLVSEYDLDLQPGHLYVSGEYVYVACGSAGLKIIDVSDPLHPVQSNQIRSLTVYELIVSGDYMYTMGGGLRIIDISDPSNPVLRGIFNANNPTSLFLQGNYIYLAGNYGLQIVDISDPLNPSLAGRFSLDIGISVFVSGNYAYLYGFSGLEIIDISDLSRLHLVGSLAIQNPYGYMSRLFVSGSYIYAMPDDLFLALQFTP
jgi:hypothetical protein